MSRKRSEEAIHAYATVRRRRGRSAASTARSAERVFEQVRGFSGFGFPKSHAAAFGLLAYQSTWLRVHYGPEFLCSLLNEQPMGFYPSDALVARGAAARDRGAASGRELAATSSARSSRSPGRCAIGLGYVNGRRAPTRREAWSPSASAAAPIATSPTWPRALASAATGSSGSAWAGACELAAAIGARLGRRSAAPALWRLGVAARRRSVASAADAQLALPLAAAGGARRCASSILGADRRRLRVDRDRPSASTR